MSAKFKDKNIPFVLKAAFKDNDMDKKHPAYNQTESH